ncbi:hypothetical protein D3C79_985320 [compost metagenome]
MAIVQQTKQFWSVELGPRFVLSVESSDLMTVISSELNQGAFSAAGVLSVCGSSKVSTDEHDS